MTVYSAQQVHDNLIQLVSAVLQQDKMLREKYQVGDRFAFVSDRLKLLFGELQGYQSDVASSQSSSEDLAYDHDALTVYVYLYNAQGLQLKSWLALLTPKALHEHAVNRPIFIDKDEIEAMLRSKPNAAQHAALVMLVKQDDIIPSLANDEVKTSLIRVREGSLKIEQVVSFFHNGSEYSFDAQNGLVKKA